MMQARFSLKSATLKGVDAVPVEVEVLVSNGLPAFSIVGMPDAAIQEARERVRAAIRACGFSMPTEKVVINLAPGSLRKTGSGFDLPIALGLLAATKQINPEFVSGCLCVGELSLEGDVRPVVGMLAYELCARDQGLRIICAQPKEGLIKLDKLASSTVQTLADFRGGSFGRGVLSQKQPVAHCLDFSEVAGHEIAKRALQIAAAGSHGVLMMGPPGSGKTMLASRLPTILPPLSEREMIEAALVHSVVGEDATPVLAGIRPFRKPHHSTSMAGLVGGGSPARPGEISLATGGVLFLDELAEFKPSVLQAIRQPMEAGQVSVTRADGNVTFPAHFMVIAATNPCPCGYFGDPDIRCSCGIPQMTAYQNRIGGPLMDRVDIHIDVWRGSPAEILHAGSGISSAALRDGVMVAREYASYRRAVEGEGKTSSSLLSSCALEAKEDAFIQEMAAFYHMSGRGIMRTLAIARTIADMDEQPAVKKKHLCEAMNMRIREGVGGM